MSQDWDHFPTLKSCLNFKPRFRINHAWQELKHEQKDVYRQNSTFCILKSLMRSDKQFNLFIDEIFAWLFDTTPSLLPLPLDLLHSLFGLHRPSYENREPFQDIFSSNLARSVIGGHSVSTPLVYMAGQLIRYHFNSQNLNRDLLHFPVLFLLCGWIVP